MNEYEAICPVCNQPVTPNQLVIHHPNHNTYHARHYPKFAAQRLTAPEIVAMAHQAQNAPMPSVETQVS